MAWLPLPPALAALLLLSAAGPCWAARIWARLNANCEGGFASLLPKVDRLDRGR